MPTNRLTNYIHDHESLIFPQASGPERKESLLLSARPFRRRERYGLVGMSYVEAVKLGPSNPMHLNNKGVLTKSYLTSNREFVLNHSNLYAFDRSNAFVTVNCYDALVLNSLNMLIVDIDFGDPRLRSYVRVGGMDTVVRRLGQLADLDAHSMLIESFKFVRQSYRAYRTHSGCRVLCTSSPVPWGALGWAARRLMHFLGGDPEYIRLCEVQMCYRARLTPKPWRERGSSSHVCEFAYWHGPDAVSEELEGQIRLHDEMTLRASAISTLA